MRLREFVAEEESTAIARTAQDLVNPPVKMQHRARRDQEREQTYQNAQRGRNDDDDLDEGASNLGAQIKAAYQRIYDAGDDAVEFAYNDSPIFAQYWDEYEGDLDSIIAEVDPSELQIILDELEAAAEDQGVAEGWTKLPSGDYQNSHTGVRTSKPPAKKKRGEKTGAEWDAIAKAKQDKQQGVAEGSDELYQKAIRKYTQRVANDYLGGGNAHLYGANNFDSEMFGVDSKQAEQDFDRLFPQYLKKLQGGEQLEETTPDAMAKIDDLFRK